FRRKQHRQCVQEDLVSASEGQAVFVMAFSVRILRYPAQWYFLSLINVNVFGIYYANQGIQLNYVYDRSTAGKGTDEVNSMLHHFITVLFFLMRIESLRATLTIVAAKTEQVCGENVAC
ncbi:hypothetical protein L915_05748, partial [Phytophthora nicotianae]